MNLLLRWHTFYPCPLLQFSFLHKLIPDIWERDLTWIHFVVFDRPWILRFRLNLNNLCSQNSETNGLQTQKFNLFFLSFNWHCVCLMNSYSRNINQELKVVMRGTCNFASGDFNFWSHNQGPLNYAKVRRKLKQMPPVFFPNIFWIASIWWGPWSC